MIVSRNYDKGHVTFTAVCLGRESFDSRPMYWSTLHVVEAMCIMLVCKHMFVVITFLALKIQS